MPAPRVAVGVDLVEVARMARLLAEQPGIRDRLFTDREQAYCEPRVRRAQNYAARFAAKEAVLKALGTGMALSPRDVQVSELGDRTATVRLVGEAAARHEALGGGRLTITWQPADGGSDELLVHARLAA